jgi:hypothetical protein
MLPKCCQAIERYSPYLPPISDERYSAAKKRFTPEAVEKIRQALNPPADFDLEEELWITVYYYHYLSDPDFLEGLPPKQQAEKLAEVERKTVDLLAMLRNQPGILVDIFDDHLLLKELETCLDHLQRHCDGRKTKLSKIGRGRHPDNGQRHFFLGLAKLHKSATGRPATRKFYRLCHELLIGSIGEDNVIRMAKEINRLYYKTA